MPRSLTGETLVLGSVRAADFSSRYTPNTGRAAPGWRCPQSSGALLRQTGDIPVAVLLLGSKLILAHP